MNGHTSKSGRKINVPNRHGKSLNLLMYTSDSGSDSEPDQFKDDSFADPSYKLPSTRVPEHNVHEHVNHSNENALDEQTAERRKPEKSDIDFNAEFEAISALRCEEHVHSPEIIEIGTIKEPNEIDDHHEDDFKLDGRTSAQLLKNSIEILARLTVIETSLLKNQLLHLGKTESHTDFKLKVEELNTFLVSNDLPLKSIEQTRKFEADLKNETFKTNAVSILIYI